MSPLLRSIALAALMAFALTACKSDSGKPQPAQQPAEKPLASQTAPTNSQQKVASGEYALLAIPQPAEAGGKIEVLEFFGYFCHFCHSFDPALSAWARKNADKVIFKRVPVAFHNTMVAQQRMYYALEAMGKLENAHSKAFEVVHADKNALRTDAEVIDFVAKQGVDAAKFKEVYESFSVQSQANNALNQQKVYAIDSVPTIAIGGKYVTSLSHAQSRAGIPQSEQSIQTTTLEIMDSLVAKAKNENAKK